MNIHVSAATEVKSETATKSATIDSKTNIKDLQDRLATKVAQLRQVQKTAFYGIVKSVSVASISVDTLTKTIKLELPDELKIYQNIKGKRTKLKPENLEKADTISVFGEYDQTIDVMKAKVIIYEEDQPIHAYGQISEIDTKAYSLKIINPENQTISVDYENSTKTSLWDQQSGMSKSGFSKLNKGDFLIVTGTQVPKKEDSISAIQILSLGNSYSQSNDDKTASPSAEEK